MMSIVVRERAQDAFPCVRWQQPGLVSEMAGTALGPIFTGGRISSQVRASEAVQRQALVSYLQTVQTAFREVDDALVNVEKSRAQLVAEGRRVAALAEYARLAKLRYDEGYASYIEVLDAQRTRFLAERDLVEADLALYLNRINLCLALGGPWGDPGRVP